MNYLLRVLLWAGPITVSALAHAQHGTLDQVAPFQSLVFNADNPGTTWQAQVRANLPGQLEGYTLRIVATAAGGTLRTAIRLGPGWNTAAPVFETTISLASAATYDFFVDTTSAGIQLVPGSVFVIEVQGQGTGTYLRGSYVDPASGPPLYSEPLFQNGPGCWLDCGARIGFETYVLFYPPPTAFCSGDGTATACPCGNVGASGHGCANSVFAGGALLSTSGTPSVSADTLILHGSDMPNSIALYVEGSISGPGVVLGDGLRCAGGMLRRLGTKTNSAGASQHPAAGDPPISSGAGFPPYGITRYYQAWYRNAASFCTVFTFNLTNGMSVAWTP